MKFLVDNQLPSALARFLAGFGAETAHVLDLGLGQSEDADLWSFAVTNKYVLISKDHDFLHFLERTLALVIAGECLIEIR